METEAIPSTSSASEHHIDQTSGVPQQLESVIGNGLKQQEAKQSEKWKLQRCPTCDYRTRQKWFMAWHLTQHENQSQPENNPNTEGKLQILPQEYYDTPAGNQKRVISCRYCKYKTPWKVNLKKHVRANHTKHNNSTTTTVPPGFCLERPVGERHNQSLNASVLQSNTGNVNQADNFGGESHSVSMVDVSFTDGEDEYAASFTCKQCHFATDNSRDWRNHKRAHKHNKKFKCRQCSYSSDNKGVVNIHLKRYHSNTAETELDVSSDESDIPRYACRLCQFTTGEERQMEKHNFCHERNKKYKCHRCSFTSDNKGVVSQHLKRHHDVRISESEKRAMLYQRPPNKESVRSSTGPVGEEEIDPNNIHTQDPPILRIECAECHFSTEQPSEMKAHENNHRFQHRFKCGTCSYSTNDNFYIDLHKKLHHHASTSNGDTTQAVQTRGLEMSSASSSVDEEAAELRRRIIEKDQETRDILKREEAECRKQIDQLKQEILQSRQSMVNLRTALHQQKQIRGEKQKKIQTFIYQLDVMREEAEVADIILKDISVKKRILQTKMIETTKRMLQLEAALSSSVLPNETGEKTKTEHIFLTLALEKTKRLEHEVKMMQDELEILCEEEKSLDEDYGLAQGSLDRANQVLQDVQPQLEELESDLQTSLESITEDQLYQLVISTEERIQVCLKLNSRLVEISSMLNKQPFN